MFLKMIGAPRTFIFLLCMATPEAHAVNEPSPYIERITPEQVGAEKRMGTILKEARELARNGSHEAAVRNYLHVFNYGRGAITLEAVRLNSIPVEVAALGEKYPHALVLLREEVRIRAGLILTGVAGTDEILEFLSLNRALNQPRRSLELYDQLKSMGERAREVRVLMLDLIGMEMLDARRFDELGARISNLAKELANRMARYEIEREFGVSEDVARGTTGEALRASIGVDGLKIHEALVVTERIEHASRLAARLVAFENTSEMYSALIKQLLENKQIEQAQELNRKAQVSLSIEAAAKVRALLAGIKQK